MIEIIPNWHPLLVHFAVGLLSTAVLFYLAAVFLSKRHPWKKQWLDMANWCLWTGCLFAIATATAGWFAYNSVAHDAASHAAMTVHRNWALPTDATFLLIGLWAIILARKERQPGFLFLSFAATAAVMLMITGWLGAEAVYRYGLGVMSLPTVEEGADGHNHRHDTMQNGTSEGEHNHAATEIDQPIKPEESQHQHDHESKEISPINEQAEGITEHTHKTMPEIVTGPSVQQSASDQHFHGSNSTKPTKASLDQDNSSEINTTPSGHHSSPHTHEHTKKIHTHQTH